MLKYLILSALSFGILAENGNTTLQDVGASKNCAKNLHECHTIRSILAGLAVLLFVTNLVTVGIWQREIIVYQYRRIVARLSSRDDHAALVDQFD